MIQEPLGPQRLLEPVRKRAERGYNSHTFGKKSRSINLDRAIPTQPLRLQRHTDLGIPPKIKRLCVSMIALKLTRDRLSVETPPWAVPVPFRGT